VTEPLSTELLGLPADARVLLVTCDDLGLHPTVNAAIVQAVEQGIARSCSLMPSCPAATHAVRLLRDRPHVPVGVHLTLVCETPAHPWGPMADPSAVPSLLDAVGALRTPGQRAELLAGARLDEVAVEFRAQLRAVLDAGLQPTHLDWHCLADGGRDDVFDLTLALADEHGLAVRAWLDHGRAVLRGRGLPVVDHAFLDSFEVGVDGPATLEQTLRELPPGLTEWAVHPGSDDPAWQAVEPDGWRVRHRDAQFLTSPQARRIVAEEGIVLIGHRELHQAWVRLRMSGSGHGAGGAGGGAGGPADGAAAARGGDQRLDVGQGGRAAPR
jgi:hypothetical protein